MHYGHLQLIVVKMIVPGDGKVLILHSSKSIIVKELFNNIPSANDCDML